MLRCFAGCLPTLATIPIFWGLYRTLSNVSQAGLLTEGFYWIPSLSGPASLADQRAGMPHIVKTPVSWLLIAACDGKGSISTVSSTRRYVHRTC